MLWLGSRKNGPRRISRSPKHRLNLLSGVNCRQLLEGLRDETSISATSNAYIYGYAVVVGDCVGQGSTKVAAPRKSCRPRIDLRISVRSPTYQIGTLQVPTLYSMAWLDLSRSPYILSVPDAYNRLPDANSRRLDGRSRKPRHANHRRQTRGLRHHRAAMGSSGTPPPGKEE